MLQVDDFTCDKDFIDLTKHVCTFLFIVFLFCAPNRLQRMFQSEEHILIVKIVYIFITHKWNDVFQQNSSSHILITSSLRNY